MLINFTICLIVFTAVAIWLTVGSNTFVLQFQSSQTINFATITTLFITLTMFSEKPLKRIST